MLLSVCTLASLVAALVTTAPQEGVTVVSVGTGGGPLFQSVGVGLLSSVSTASSFAGFIVSIDTSFDGRIDSLGLHGAHSGPVWSFDRAAGVLWVDYASPVNTSTIARDLRAVYWTGDDHDGSGLPPGSCGASDPRVVSYTLTPSTEPSNLSAYVFHAASNTDVLIPRLPSPSSTQTMTSFGTKSNRACPFGGTFLASLVPAVNVFLAAKAQSVPQSSSGGSPSSSSSPCYWTTADFIEQILWSFPNAPDSAFWMGGAPFAPVSDTLGYFPSLSIAPGSTTLDAPSQWQRFQPASAKASASPVLTVLAAIKGRWMVGKDLSNQSLQCMTPCYRARSASDAVQARSLAGPVGFVVVARPCSALDFDECVAASDRCTASSSTLGQSLCVDGASATVVPAMPGQRLIPSMTLSSFACHNRSANAATCLGNATATKLCEWASWTRPATWPVGYCRPSSAAQRCASLAAKGTADCSSVAGCALPGSIGGPCAPPPCALIQSACACLARVDDCQWAADAAGGGGVCAAAALLPACNLSDVVFLVDARPAAQSTPTATFSSATLAALWRIRSPDAFAWAGTQRIGVIPFGVPGIAAKIVCTQLLASSPAAFDATMTKLLTAPWLRNATAASTAAPVTEEAFQCLLAGLQAVPPAAVGQGLRRTVLIVLSLENLPTLSAQVGAAIRFGGASATEFRMDAAAAGSLRAPPLLDPVNDVGMLILPVSVGSELGNAGWMSKYVCGGSSRGPPPPPSPCSTLRSKGQCETAPLSPPCAWESATQTCSEDWSCARACTAGQCAALPRCSWTGTACTRPCLGQSAASCTAPCVVDGDSGTCGLGDCIGRSAVECLAADRSLSCIWRAGTCLSADELCEAKIDESECDRSVGCGWDRGFDECTTAIHEGCGSYAGMEDCVSGGLACGWNVTTSECVGTPCGGRSADECIAPEFAFAAVLDDEPESCQWISARQVNASTGVCVDRCADALSYYLFQRGERPSRCLPCSQRVSECDCLRQGTDASGCVWNAASRRCLPAWTATCPANVELHFVVDGSPASRAPSRDDATFPSLARWAAAIAASVVSDTSADTRWNVSIRSFGSPLTRGAFAAVATSTSSFVSWAISADNLGSDQSPRRTLSDALLSLPPRSTLAPFRLVVVITANRTLLVEGAANPSLRAALDTLETESKTTVFSWNIKRGEDALSGAGSATHAALARTLSEQIASPRLASLRLQTSNGSETPLAMLPASWLDSSAFADNVPVDQLLHYSRAICNPSTALYYAAFPPSPEARGALIVPAVPSLQSRPEIQQVCAEYSDEQSCVGITLQRCTWRNASSPTGTAACVDAPCSSRCESSACTASAEGCVWTTTRCEQTCEAIVNADMCGRRGDCSWTGTRCAVFIATATSTVSTTTVATTTVTTIVTVDTATTTTNTESALITTTTLTAASNVTVTSTAGTATNASTAFPTATTTVSTGQPQITSTATITTSALTSTSTTTSPAPTAACGGSSSACSSHGDWDPPRCVCRCRNQWTATACDHCPPLFDAARDCGSCSVISSTEPYPSCRTPATNGTVANGSSSLSTTTSPTTRVPPPLTTALSTLSYVTFSMTLSSPAGRAACLPCAMTDAASVKAFTATTAAQIGDWVGKSCPVLTAASTAQDFPLVSLQRVTTVESGDKSQTYVEVAGVVNLATKSQADCVLLAVQAATSIPPFQIDPKAATAVNALIVGVPDVGVTDVKPCGATTAATSSAGPESPWYCSNEVLPAAGLVAAPSVASSALPSGIIALLVIGMLVFVVGGSCFAVHRYRLYRERQLRQQYVSFEDAAMSNCQLLSLTANESRSLFLPDEHGDHRVELS